MLLKRIHEQGQCVGVEVKHTGLKPRQNFSHRMIEQAMAEGWVQIDGDTLTMTADPEPLRYKLLRRPGYYCTSNGERIPISELAWTRMRATGIGDLSRKEALAWLQANKKGEGDYEVTNAYECELDPKLHAKYRGVTAPSGQLKAAHTIQEKEKARG